MESWMVAPEAVGVKIRVAQPFIRVIANSSCTNKVGSDSAVYAHLKKVLSSWRLNTLELIEKVPFVYLLEFPARVNQVGCPVAAGTQVLSLLRKYCKSDKMKQSTARWTGVGVEKPVV